MTCYFMLGQVISGYFLLGQVNFSYARFFQNSPRLVILGQDPYG